MNSPSEVSPYVNIHRAVSITGHRAVSITSQPQINEISPNYHDPADYQVNPYPQAQ